jgi:hypothetical protein
MNIFITLDYELFFGSNTGTQINSIIKPTNELLKIFDRHDVKASFFVDSGYIYKLNSLRINNPKLDKNYKEIVEQIEFLFKNGHDIQLHIHPHWEDSHFIDNKWIINSKRYRLHDFSIEEIGEIVTKYKKILTDIVGDKVFAYRAGGWCIQPFEKLKKAMQDNDVWLDSTLYEGGFNCSNTHYFDFRNMPKKSIYRFNNDPLIECNDGYFLEIPISSYKISPLFFWKLAYIKKNGSEIHKNFGDGKAIGVSKKDMIRMLTRYSNSVVSLDGYKASILEEAFNFYNNVGAENFVIIGHPKALSKFSFEKLSSFIKKNIDYNNFTTYSNEYINYS